MKKLIFTMALMLPMVVLGASIQTIRAEWATRVINHVPTGGLGIMLERFDQTWPTAAGGDICQVMQLGVAKKVLDPDDGYTVEVDAKNGYAESYNGGSDRQYMSACVWRRSNGHRLFAVVIGQPVDPEIEIICFYDYDPQKHTLTPEPNAIGDWMDRTARGDYSFKLPREGKELLIFDSRDQLSHHFRWNGMRPVFDRTEQTADVTPDMFPGGLADDGRGPEETEPDGTVIQYDGEQYIRVHTAEQFLRSIISGCNILVAKDTEINLTPLLNNKAWWNKQNYYFKWCSEGEPSLTDMGQRITSEEVFDGRQLTIQNYKQIVIQGEGNSRIVVEPRYAFCMNFLGCEQIEIRNLTIGHTTGGYCQGGVIGVQGGWRISIQSCDLYGCGTYGLELNATRDFSMYRSVIHDCTYGIMTLQDVEFAKFEQCDFRNNREFTLVDSRGSNVQFNECRFYANAGTAPLFGFDREFFMQGCTICHPTLNLGTIHLADQSGAKNWFDPNPLNPDLPQRSIGPDQK
ncbi:MAG: right-handed parallel beta-helix repeat-containing protein [Prevotella sp.]|nr:right-handed parallel beta-helix repeat-containing protein [Prevotella sp.]